MSSNPVPIELQAKISVWRQRAADGTLTMEEMKEAILHLRAGRVSAAASAGASAARRKRAIVEIPKAEDLLDEIG